MSDLSITVASVACSTNSSTQTRPAVAGEAITQGAPVYLDATTGQAKLATAFTLAKSKAVGIALNSASSGQPMDYCIQDSNFNVGATLTAGAVLMLSATTTGGKITITPADIVTGNFPTVIGVATGTATAKIRFNDIHQAGVAKA